MIVTKTWTESEEVDVPDGYEIVGDRKRTPEPLEHFIGGNGRVDIAPSEYKLVGLYWIVKKSWVPPVSAPKGTHFFKYDKDWYVKITSGYASGSYYAESVYSDFVPPVDCREVTIK